MGIDAHLEDEGGTAIQIVGDPKSILTRAVLEGHFSSGPICLRFLDPYGDAAFNHLQWPFLAAELREVLDSSSDPELRGQVEKVLRLIDKGRKRLHHYIKFYGD